MLVPFDPARRRFFRRQVGRQNITPARRKESRKRLCPHSKPEALAPNMELPSLVEDLRNRAPFPEFSIDKIDLGRRVPAINFADLELFFLISVPTACKVLVTTRNGSQMLCGSHQSS